MNPKLIIPFYSETPLLLEIPVVITKGASEKRHLMLNDLIYVEACQHRLLLHTVQGTFVTRCTFSDLSAVLSECGIFFHPGKGLLINFSHVFLITEEGSILLKNGDVVFCSRRKRKETREAFRCFSQKHSFSKYNAPSSTLK